MRIILLSGGSGKRLWPLSNDARSKQFLKVLKNNDGKMESMLQRVWGQLSRVGLAENTVIATSKSQIETIQNQLDENVSLIVEPERRDTFPAIALSAAFLNSEKEASRDEVVVVLPVDPYVEDAFFKQIIALEEAIREQEAKIALIGVKPTYPSTKYGYIVPENTTQDGIVVVSSFTEKPNEDYAKNLIERNALWNCGVFAFKLDYVLSIMEEKGYSTDYEELKNNYINMPKISFDYEVVENTDKIFAIPYDGYWKDLGTWNTLTEEMPEKQIGKGVVSEDSSNIHMINELEIPITVLGVQNLIIAASPDGILVSDKEASPKIKELVSNLESRPMYEERRWGNYKVLDFSKFEDGYEVLTKRICIKKGKNLSYQQHFSRSEVWTIIKGNGELILDERLYQVSTGDVFNIPISSKHAIKAITDLEIIEVQQGSNLVEEDIIRLVYEWKDIVELCKYVNI